MKTLLLITICLLSFKSNGQKIIGWAYDDKGGDTTILYEYGIIKTVSSKMTFGSLYTYAPQVIKISDGTWEVRGDSMTAIKMLWKEIERRDSIHEADKRELFRIISAQKNQIKACQEYRKGIDKIIKSLNQPK